MHQQTVRLLEAHSFGTEIARRTGFRLFHNHKTIDLVLPFFAFGTPAYSRLVREFRRRLLEEIAASELPGVIFTYVWAFDQYQLNSGGRFDDRSDYLRLDNTKVSAPEMAERVVAHFDLPRDEPCEDESQPAQ